MLSSAIALIEQRHPGIIPDLRKHQTILIGSDYGGCHRAAEFEVASFLVTNLESIGAWNAARSRLRKAGLPQNRRMSYKALGDHHRKKALMPFLETADHITGLLISIAVDRTISSLFEGERTGEERAILREVFNGWKPEPIERAMRIMHFAGLILRGISRGGQDVWWFTDQDEVVANQARLRTFVSTMATISSHYLPHQLRQLRIGTTACDTANHDLEDYLAVPDLAAGALQELLSNGDARLLLDTPSLFLPNCQTGAPKARCIMNWFSDITQNLRRVTLVMDEPVLGKPRITTFRAHGSREQDAPRYAQVAESDRSVFTEHQSAQSPRQRKISTKEQSYGKML